MRNDNKFVVLPADGDGPLTTVRTDIPGGGDGGTSSRPRQGTWCVVLLLSTNRVYFTDRGGRVVHVATDCEGPRCPAVTSWGHVLIADYGVMRSKSSVKWVTIWADCGTTAGR